MRHATTDGTISTRGNYFHRLIIGVLRYTYDVVSRKSIGDALLDILLDARPELALRALVRVILLQLGNSLSPNDRRPVELDVYKQVVGLAIDWSQPTVVACCLSVTMCSLKATIPIRG